MMTVQKYILLISLLVGATLPTMLWAADIDTDNDGFTDSEEAFIGTDPNDSDTDDDGILDSAEALVYTDPLLYDTITTDSYTSDYELDTDADGLSNGYELYDGRLGDVQVGNFTGEGGNPVNPDTDEDGLGDWFEATYAGTCVDITINNSDHDDTTDANEDCDNDGLINSVEEDLGTSPLASDTDGDGFSDAAEATAGSDPTDASITPDTILDDSEEVDDSVDEEVNEEEETSEEEDVNLEEENRSEIITSVVKESGTLEITYNDNVTNSVTPFNGNDAFRYAISQDNTRLLVTNGKLLKVYVLAEQVAKKKVNTKKPAKKKYFKLFTKSLYSNYETVLFLSATKNTGKIVVFRLTEHDELKKKVIKKQVITKRNQLKLSIRPNKHRFTTTFGSGADHVQTTWKLKSTGKVKLVR